MGLPVDEIRERFLKFFEERGHRIYPSDSLVPCNDPSLLFTGAGMNQFKEEFLGRVKDTKRAATCQKCLRTGDLENVGKTPGHHTFFEMLGNFSFGDYFKKDAILWAWEFLTDELGLQPNDLWVSVYKDDKDSYDIWKDIVKIPKEKISMLGEKENFWPSNAPSQGPNGPCGPCSEIFFGGPDGVEVWNLVFTQFDRKDDGVLEPLPNKNIDTGMGLERIARVLQGKKTNFEIDLFEPIIEAIKALTLTLSHFKEMGEGESEGAKLNAIADHIRAVTFAISDGVLPSNEERGYVIRKLIRRSFWYGKSLGLEKPFLYRIVPVVARVMKKPYPELTEHRENISQVVLEEEKRFKNTLDEGIERLKIMIGESKVLGVLPGESVFKLYDTYGFPLELTQEIASGENIKVDLEGFNSCMEQQRVKSKEGTKIKDSIFGPVSLEEAMLVHVSSRFAKASFMEDKGTIDTKVLAITVDGKVVQQLTEGQKGNVLLDVTNFYGEKGGQVGDVGVFLKKDCAIADVVNAIDITGKTWHEVTIKKGILKLDDVVTAKIDMERREDIKRNHTATHILHNALRKVLGSHVKQAGSLVAPDRLRFDFTHFKAVTDEELSRIEDIVNENIRKNSPVTIEEMDIEEAKKKDVIALFGEKYGEKVRMVSVGDYSRELCGGTHLKNTGVIGVFKIISESSIASGMRRIEAITGKAAYDKIKQDQDMIKEIADGLNVKPENITEGIDKLTARLKQLEKALENFINKSAQENVDILLKSAKRIKGIDVIIAEIKNADANLLRKNAELIKERFVNGIFVVVSEKDGKIAMITGIGRDVGTAHCAVPTNKNADLDAARILNDTGGDFSIKGGGRKDFAQAGGRSGADIKEILNKAEKVIEGYL